MWPDWDWKRPAHDKGAIDSAYTLLYFKKNIRYSGDA